MIRILFVCHGNICRSPMAEFVMKDLAEKVSVSHLLHIESAATSSEELGNSVYPPARRMMAQHGISCDGKRARQIRAAEYDDWDLIIGMDQRNLRNMLRIFRDDPEQKIHLLLDYADRSGEEVADPWYTGDFQATWDDVQAGCQGLLKELNLLP